jgi:molybdopterin-binding protein
MMQLSARNQIRGQVRSVKLEGLVAEVSVDIGGQDIVSSITRASAERLGVKVGDQVTVIIKASEVLIGK